MTNDALAVRFDGTAFEQHRRSGISRYFAEIIHAFGSDPALGVEPILPYRYVTSVHAGIDRGLRPLPLPRRLRRPVLSQLNRRRASRSPAARVIHYPLYEASLLDQARLTRSVTTIYDFTAELFPELVPASAEHLATKRQFIDACDVLVAISETTARDIRTLLPDIDKPVVVTPLAVADEFRARPGRPLRGLPERYLLFVGNRAPHKNVDLLLRAFAHLADHDRALGLVLSGASPADEQARLHQLGIADRVKRVKVSDRDLPRLYQHASAMVLPSRYEGFGLPVVEAMAAGCPVVVSDAPALVEVADEAADVVGPDDLDGLVSALERLIGDPDLAQRRRETGRARAADFTWARTARLTREAYALAAALPTPPQLEEGHP